MISREYHGIARAISAPNRYRKMLNKQEAITGSAGVVLALMGAASVPASIIELQRKEWPDDAHRALGIEPDFDSNLTDVVLLWDGAEPLHSDLVRVSQ